MLTFRMLPVLMPFDDSELSIAVVKFAELVALRGSAL